MTDIDTLLGEAVRTTIQFERHWLDLGREIKAAEDAGKSGLVDTLIDRSDAELSKLSPGERQTAKEFHARGREERV